MIIAVIRAMILTIGSIIRYEWQRSFCPAINFWLREAISEASFLPKIQIWILRYPRFLLNYTNDLSLASLITAQHWILLEHGAGLTAGRAMIMPHAVVQIHLLSAAKRAWDVFGRLVFPADSQISQTRDVACEGFDLAIKLLDVHVLEALENLSDVVSFHAVYLTFSFFSWFLSTSLDSFASFRTIWV